MKKHNYNYLGRLIGLVMVLLMVVSVATGQSQVSKSTGPPAFFLQDPTDGACLAGDTYKRCGLDTLWFVTGKPGSYQIHHRPVDEADSDEESCFSKVQCHLDETEGKLLNCDHCGSKKWNIVGDTDTGI
jgi:hypothetical protein